MSIGELCARRKKPSNSSNNNVQKFLESFGTVLTRLKPCYCRQLQIWSKIAILGAFRLIISLKPHTYSIKSINFGIRNWKQKPKQIPKMVKIPKKLIFFHKKPWFWDQTQSKIMKKNYFFFIQNLFFRRFQINIRPFWTRTLFFSFPPLENLIDITIGLC